MTATTEAVPAASPAFDFAALKAMLQDTIREETAPLQAEIANLQKRVVAQEKSVPRFFTEKTERTGGDYRQTLADMAQGEAREGSKGRIPMLANGKVLPQTVLDMMTPAFQDGESVRLDLDQIRVEASPAKAATRNSPALEATESKTWGDICAAHNCNGTGHILRRLDVLTQYGWLYHVHIDGIHAKDRFQSLPENVLLAAS